MTATRDTSGNATDGLVTVADLSGASTTDDVFDALLAILPNPDAAHGDGAVAGGGFLDEMSPGAAAALRAELLEAKDVCDNASI